MSKLLEVIKLLRPQQWFKNIFVLAGVVFSPLAHRADLYYSAFLATLVFCGLASSVYLFNDIIDYPQDRLHAHKKLRPLAAGTITLTTAWILYISLSLICLGLSMTISPIFSCISVSYLLLNIAYTLYLKHIFIVDVLCIAAGFILRILAGTTGIFIVPSQWLIICTLSLALFLGFSKRYIELNQSNSNSLLTRKVLRQYTPLLLKKLMLITALGTLTSYSIYTVDISYIKKQQTVKLLITIFPVLFGILKYFHLILMNQLKNSQDIAVVIFRDTQILLCIFIWLCLILLLIK